MAIYFYSAQDQPYGCFSNFSLHGFQLDGHWWTTSEHYYQAQKVVGTPDFAQVRCSPTPEIAKQTARACTCRTDWEQVKDEVMYRALWQKFSNHSEICDRLLATGEEVLIENSPTDYYWGCGADGSGRNRLGEILMEVRSRLSLQSSSHLNSQPSSQLGSSKQSSSKQSPSQLRPSET